MKLVEVFFGIWTNPVSAADKKLVAVNSSGAVEVREEYKSRLSWKVNVTSSVAVFVLHNVRLDDGNKYYGIHVEFDLHYPLIDTLKLQVETKRKGRMVCADFAMVTEGEARIIVYHTIITYLSGAKLLLFQNFATWTTWQAHVFIPLFYLLFITTPCQATHFSEQSPSIME